jgi:hypothetical protein
MSKIVTGEMVIQFLLGFLVGKIIGTIVSTMPFVGLYLEDSSLGDLLWVEFTTQLLSFNAYHYALAIIVGLILVIWKSNDLFEE